MVTTCDQVTASAISIANNSSTGTMSITIYNPNPYPVTAQDVHIVWNAATGAPQDEPLKLLDAILVDFLQTVNDGSGDITIIPASSMVMPANAISQVLFEFNNNYQNLSGQESIVIHLSTPGCENYVIQSFLPTPAPTPTP
jgi:hypothetical protein